MSDGVSNLFDKISAVLINDVAKIILNEIISGPNKIFIFLIVVIILILWYIIGEEIFKKIINSNYVKDKDWKTILSSINSLILILIIFLCFNILLDLAANLITGISLNIIEIIFAIAIGLLLVFYILMLLKPKNGN